MTNIQLLIIEPDISFDACTPPAERIVERNSTPVVVVRVARNRRDIACDVY